jgi:hypothetical protein
MSAATPPTRSRKRRFLAATLAAGFTMLAFTETAQAQEIFLTGPLAGAPAVRKLRLYREGRFELAPNATFTLLDEYQRTILLGLRINYNFTDWLALGVWGGYGGLLQIPTDLSDRIQDVNEQRQALEPGVPSADSQSLERRLTATNIGPDFTEQLGSLDWVAAPQITAVPFRGKIALFQSIYFDTDLYFFVGPAFIGLKERGECETDCNTPDTFELASRVAIAPTFGLGLTFYVNKWNALGFEYRALPFAWNRGGFDVAGRGENEEFPDGAITGADQTFRFNQMLTVSWNFYLPTQYRISE